MPSPPPANVHLGNREREPRSAGTEGCSSEVGTQASWVQGQLAFHTAPGLMP